MNFDEYLKENGSKVFGVMVLLLFVIAISGCTLLTTTTSVVK